VAQVSVATLHVESESAVAGSPARIVKIDRSDMPAARANADEHAAFARGDVLFESTFRASDGLGPLYIRDSCVSCHAGDGRGPGVVTRVALGSDAKGVHLAYGDVVRPYYLPPATEPLYEQLPEGARATHRLPPAVFGRGAMEAVADSEIERLAEEASRRAGPIKGLVHRVPDAAGGADRIGRFGLKARIATLDEFTADALQGDMGLTSPLRPRELENPEGVDDDAKPGIDVSDDAVRDLADYVRLLELPARTELSEAGARSFREADCAVCHVPTLQTRKDERSRRLYGDEVAVYTDFLLHDMGDALADGVRDGAATFRQWRTAPLIGLRFSPALLHDGRAKTVREAIGLHRSPGSEASGAVDRFDALSEREQNDLIDFVEKL
jgi:CxxC motif-containing protein (DUF1111 family)